MLNIEFMFGELDYVDYDFQMRAKWFSHKDKRIVVKVHYLWIEMYSLLADIDDVHHLPP